MLTWTAVASSEVHLCSMSWEFPENKAFEEVLPSNSIRQICQAMECSYLKKEKLAMHKDSNPLC